MSPQLTHHRGGGPAPPPSWSPSSRPPPPAAAPAPHRLPAAAPHRLQNHTRKHLNTQLRAAAASLIGIHRPMRQLQFLLRSLYRRTARTMLENTPARGRAGMRARRRLAGRTLQMRNLVRAARRAFGAAEARGGVVVAYVARVVGFWRDQLGVPGFGPGFPRAFGRDERRLWGVVERLVEAWEAVYHEVGVMVRDFFEEGAEMYCGMQ